MEPIDGKHVKNWILTGRNGTKTRKKRNETIKKLTGTLSDPARFWTSSVVLAMVFGWRHVSVALWHRPPIRQGFSSCGRVRPLLVSANKTVMRITFKVYIAKTCVRPVQ